MSNLADFLDAHPSYAYVAESMGYAGLCSDDTAWSYAAADYGSGKSGHWLACEMSRAQQCIIDYVCTRRGQLMRPMLTAVPGICVWCHACALGEQQARPQITWTRLDNGDWRFESITGSVVASVKQSGALVGWTLSYEAITADFDWIKADPTPETCGKMPFSRNFNDVYDALTACLLYTSPSPRDGLLSRMPSSA